MSVFHNDTTGRAQREFPAKGALTGPKDPPPTADRGSSVRHVPNADAREQGR